MKKEEVTGIYYLCNYEPYKVWNGFEMVKNTSFNKNNGGRLLDLKDIKENAISYYTGEFDRELKEILNSHKDICIAIVPSHKPDKKNSGIKEVAKKLIKKYNLVDATECLVRYIEIDKLAHGGDRSIETHLNSIKVENPHLINDSRIIIMDDITTSGNSLLACKQLLEEANAKKVICVAVGKTKSHKLAY